MITNPDLLPKVRSEVLLRSISGELPGGETCQPFPCSLRIASFLGLPCSPIETVVGAHQPTIGKGAATKVSDIFAAAGCRLCHDLLDGRDPRIHLIAEKYPYALAERIMKAGHETQARWVGLGLIQVVGGEII